MARFLPEYKEIDTRPFWEKAALIISLFILCLFVPATVLGYYAEKSLPGQPLYPVKRGIESAILAIESVTPYGKSLYYQALASKRVDETAMLIAQAETSGNFPDNFGQSDATLNEFVLSVREAALTAQSITNPDEKKRAKVQLAQSIQHYQTQLTQMHYVIQQHNTTQTTNTTPDNQATPTPTPALSDTTAVSTLENQITQVQQDLTTINTNIQQNIPIPTPTPTTVPTATPTPSPTPIPTATPTPRHKDRQEND